LLWALFKQNGRLVEVATPLICDHLEHEYR
jgi:hypothetical protein